MTDPLRNVSKGSDFVTPIWRLRQHTGHTAWTVCAICGDELDEKPKGRTRDYCSPACRQKAYRLRKGELAEELES